MAQFRDDGGIMWLKFFLIGRQGPTCLESANIVAADNFVTPMASFTEEIDPGLAQRPMKTNGRLANRRLTSLVKEATGALATVAALT